MKSLKRLKLILWLLVITALPIMAFAANSDPFTGAGNGMKNILFGTLGTSLCAIIIGATFLMAKVGKISWDKFVQVGLCTAGFLGAPSIVTLVKSWVG